MQYKFTKKIKNVNDGNTGIYMPIYTETPPFSPFILYF